MNGHTVYHLYATLSLKYQGGTENIPTINRMQYIKTTLHVLFNVTLLVNRSPPPPDKRHGLENLRNMVVIPSMKPFK